MSRWMATLALLATLLMARPAGAASTTPAPLPDGCMGSALVRPDCGTEPQASGDRGGAAQLALFVIVAVGMGTVLVVVIRASNRRTAAAG